MDIKKNNKKNTLSISSYNIAAHKRGILFSGLGGFLIFIIIYVFIQLVDPIRLIYFLFTKN